MSEDMSSSYLNSISSLKPFFKKAQKSCHFLSASYRRSPSSHSFTAFLMICSITCFFLVMGSAYFYMSPSSETVFDISELTDTHRYSLHSPPKACNVFEGKWVPADENYYPLYNASNCPFIERGFDCLANGRMDRDYLKWRWEPHDCKITKFDARRTLEFLRGKRVVFVGDSLSRTQWESMVCMLMGGVEEKEKSSVVEMNGNRVTKRVRHLGVRFDAYDRLSIEFYRSIFLVQHGPPPRHSPRRVKAVVRLDRLDGVRGEWVDSDVLVFNSGHWWTSTKLFEMGWYFQIGSRIKYGLPIRDAFEVALATWRSWADNAIDPNRTRVFFRTFESTHWSGSRQNCSATVNPSVDPRMSSVSESITSAVKRASLPVELLHVTRMGASRGDAHVGYWGDQPGVLDCSHWCLPGLPDMWNEILFSVLLSGSNRP